MPSDILFEMACVWVSVCPHRAGTPYSVQVCVWHRARTPWHRYIIVHSWGKTNFCGKQFLSTLPGPLVLQPLYGCSSRRQDGPVVPFDRSQHRPCSSGARSPRSSTWRRWRPHWIGQGRSWIHRDAEPQGSILDKFRFINNIISRDQYNIIQLIETTHCSFWLNWMLDRKEQPIVTWFWRIWVFFGERRQSTDVWSFKARGWTDFFMIWIGMLLRFFELASFLYVWIGMERFLQGPSIMFTWFAYFLSDIDSLYLPRIQHWSHVLSFWFMCSSRTTSQLQKQMEIESGHPWGVSTWDSGGVWDFACMHLYSMLYNRNNRIAKHGCIWLPMKCSFVWHWI